MAEDLTYELFVDGWPGTDADITAFDQTNFFLIKGTVPVNQQDREPIEAIGIHHAFRASILVGTVRDGNGNVIEVIRDESTRLLLQFNPATGELTSNDGEFNINHPARNTNSLNLPLIDHEAFHGIDIAASTNGIRTGGNRRRRVYSRNRIEFR